MADGRARPGQPMQPSLDDQAGKAAVLGVYRQARTACRRFPEATVARRFEVLKGCGAISKLFERPNERYCRATFAPYIRAVASPR